MKQNNFDTKKAISALIAAGMIVSSGAVFAEYDPDKVVDTSLDYVTLSDEYLETSALDTYNGTSLLTGIQNIDGHIMFPVRYVFEGLAFDVNWDGDAQKIVLNRGALEVGMYINQDAYYISKRVAEPLGIAPTLVNDETTYAPIELLTDLLGIRVIDNNDGTATVVDPSVVTFSSFNADNKSITVLDPIIGEVIVYITDDSIITLNGENANIDAVATLSEGQEIKVSYDAAMTLSLPAQTSAIAIDILSDVVSDIENDATEIENVEFSGIITSVDENEKTVTVSENGSELVLNILDTTIIGHGGDKRIYKIDDLTVGTEIKGTREGIETKSLPPISNAISVEIVNFAE